MIKKKRVHNTNKTSVVEMKHWKGRLKDVPCFIIGAGPSLEECDLSPLQQAFTIAINRACYKIDPTILFWQDQHFYWDEKKRIEPLQAIRCCRYSPAVPQNFHFFRVINSEFQLTGDPSLLSGRGASGPLAFQLAVLLGCNPIVLLGMDCCYRGEKTNFYGVNRMHSQWTLPNCSRGLRWMASMSSEVRIINCSKNDVFDVSRPLQDVVKELIPPFFSKESLQAKILAC